MHLVIVQRPLGTSSLNTVRSSSRLLIPVLNQPLPGTVPS
jgi:hypothetical protein